MSEDTPSTKSATEIMAALVAKRRATEKTGVDGGRGRKGTERAAAALSASKSKPALRK